MSDDDTCFFTRREEKPQTRKKSKSVCLTPERKQDIKTYVTSCGDQRNRCPSTWLEIYQGKKRTKDRPNGPASVMHVKVIWNKGLRECKATIDPKSFSVHETTNTPSVFFINDLFRTPQDALCWVRNQVETALRRKHGASLTVTTRYAPPSDACTPLFSARYTNLKIEGKIDAADAPAFTPGSLRQQLCPNDSQFSMLDCLDSGVREMLLHSPIEGLNDDSYPIVASNSSRPGISTQVLTSFFCNNITKSLSDITSTIFANELCQHSSAPPHATTTTGKLETMEQVYTLSFTLSFSNMLENG